MFRKKLVTCLGAFILASAPEYSEAAVFSWTGGPDLNTAGNWTPSGPPGPTDTGLFAGAGSPSPTLGSSMTVNVFQASAPHSFSINTNGNLTYANNGGFSSSVTGNTFTLNSNGQINFITTSTAAISSAVTYTLNGTSAVNFTATSSTGLANFVFGSTSSLLSFNQSISSSVNGSITGTAGSGSTSTGLVINSTSNSNICTFTGTGIKTYSGQTSLEMATLQAGATDAFSPNSDIVMSSTGILDLNSFDNEIGSLTGLSTNQVTLGSGTLTTGGTNASTTYSGSVSGAGGLTKVGTGIFTLSGSGLNTYSGRTNVNLGTLQAGATNAFSPNSGVVLIGATVLDLNNFDNTILVLAGTGATSVTLGSGTLTLLNTSNAAFGGSITGTGGLTINGPAIFTLGGPGSNTYSGDTNINSGTLRSGALNSFSPNSNVIMTDSSSLDLNGNNNTIASLTGSSTNTVTLGGGTLTTNGNNSSTTFAGAITGTGGLTKNGSGVLTLGGPSLNTYNGTTTINAGTLRSGTLNSFSPNSSVVMTGSAILDLNNFNNTIGSLAGAVGNLVTLGTATLTTGGNNASSTYAGAITGTGGLIKNGTGIFTLSGSALNTYSGQTTINAGTLRAGAINAFSPNSAIVMTGTSILDLNNFDNTIPSLTGTSGNLVTLGTGTLTTGDGTNTTYAGAITGTGGLTKNGTGIFTLSGSGLNTYSGQTTINTGTLRSGATNSFSPNSSVVMTDSSIMDLNSFNNTIGSLAGTGTNQVTLGSGTLTTGGNNTSSIYAGAITGSGGLTKNGTGTFTLSGSGLNIYSGQTTINAGTLRSGALNSFSPNSAVVMTDSSVMDLGNNNNTILSLTGTSSNKVLLGNGVLTVQNPNNTVYNGIITGTALGGLTKNGAGTFTLGGSGLATYSGTTTINNGTLQSGATNSFSPTSAVVMTDSSILDLNNFNNEIASLTGTSSNLVTLGSGTLTTGGNNSSTTYAGAITGTGGLNKVGTGTFTLSGSSLNSYSGNTLVSAGTLAAGATNSFSPNSNVSVASGAALDSEAFSNKIGALTAAAGSTVNVLTPGTLTFGNSLSTAIAGAFTGNGTLQTQGAGTITYTGNSPTFTGMTNIGNALFSLSGFLGGNAALVNGAKLSGNGTLGGNLLVNSGTTISPGGDGSIATLSINGNYTQNTNSTYVANINNAFQSDLINVGGTASLNGGTVQAIPLGGYNLNHKYLILSAGGGVSSTFQGATAPSITGLVIPTLNYTPNDVFLSIQTNIISAACTPNTQVIATKLDNIVDPSEDILFILNSLIGLNDADVCAILNELTGQQFTLAFVEAESNSRQFLRRLYDPLRALVTALPSCCTGCDMCSCNDPCRTQLTPWLEGGGGRTVIHGNHHVKGLNLDSAEVTGGIQGTRGDLTLGVAGSYDHDHVDFRFHGKGKSDTGYSALYGLYRPSNCSSSRWYVLGDIAYGYTTNKTRRHTALGGHCFQMKSKYHLTQVFGYVEGGFDIYTKCVLVQPFVGLEAGSFRRGVIHERGRSPLNLSVKRKTLDDAYSRLGVHLTTEPGPLPNCGRAQSLFSNANVSLDLAWSYRWTGNSGYHLTESFQLFGDNFRIKGLKNGRNSLDGALTVSANIHDKWLLFVEANGTYWGKSGNYNVLGGVAYTW